MPVLTPGGAGAKRDAHRRVPRLRRRDIAPTFRDVDSGQDLSGDLSGEKLKIARAGDGRGVSASGGVETFLLDFIEALHSVAVPIPEIEERVHAVGRALGLDADAFMLQSVVVLTARRSRLRRIDFEYHWNLRRLGQLRTLTRELIDGHVDLPRGRSELARIMSQRARFARWQVVLCYGVYGSAVSARIGGAWTEMAIGALVGLVAGAIHLSSAIDRPVDLLKSFIAALAGSLVVFALTLVLPPFDFARSLFGGICMLVPAMGLTIGVYEIADDALEGGLFRLAYSILRFLMLGLGIGVAIQVWKPLRDLSEFIATPLPWPVVLACVLVGGLALTVCLQARARDLPWVVAGALVGHGSHLLTKVVLGGDGSPLIAALILGLLGVWQGRRPGHALGTVLIPGLLQMAPGFVGTAAVMQLLRGHAHGESATFFKVGLVALQLVIGVMLAPLILRRKRVPASA